MIWAADGIHYIWAKDGFWIFFFKKIAHKNLKILWFIKKMILEVQNSCDLVMNGVQLPVHTPTHAIFSVGMELKHTLFLMNGPLGIYYCTYGSC